MKISQWAERFGHPYLLLVLTTLFWSGNMVVGRGLRDAIPPISLAIGRWIIAFVLTLPFAWPHLPALRKLSLRQWGVLLVLGILGVGAYNTLAYLALTHTTATNAALLNSFIPVAIIGLSWFLGRRLGAREGLGVAISLAGVLTIVSRGNPPALLDLTLNVGDLWMLAAVLSWALYTLCLQWRPDGLHPMALLAVLTAIGLAVLLPFWVAELSDGARVAPTPAVLAGVAYTGVFPAFLGYVFWNRAVGQVGGSKAGLFIHLMPVFSTLLAALFLGELPKTFHFAGIALILSGIWLTTARRRG